MRKIVRLNKPMDDIRRLMICSTADGTFLFLFKGDKDGPCDADVWFESSEDAELFCSTEYAIKTAQWELIPDPKPGCQQDWIAPTRIRRDPQGKLVGGQFESAE